LLEGKADSLVISEQSDTWVTDYTGDTGYKFRYLNKPIPWIPKRIYRNRIQIEMNYRLRLGAENVATRTTVGLIAHGPMNGFSDKRLVTETIKVPLLKSAVVPDRG